MPLPSSTLLPLSPITLLGRGLPFPGLAPLVALSLASCLVGLNPPPVICRSKLSSTDPIPVNCLAIVVDPVIWVAMPPAEAGTNVLVDSCVALLMPAGNNI
jgi:hypothetical protein